MYYVCAHTVHANSGPWVSGPRVPGPRSRGLRVPGTVSPCILVVECLLVHVSSLSSVPCLFTHLLGMGFDTFALAYILSRGWNRVQISSTALIWYCIDMVLHWYGTALIQTLHWYGHTRKWFSHYSGAQTPPLMRRVPWQFLGCAESTVLISDKQWNSAPSSKCVCKPMK